MAEVLAVCLRAVSWMKAHEEGTVSYKREFYEKGGSPLSERFLDTDYSDLLLLLSAEIALFSRDTGPSVADKWNADAAE